MKSQAQKEKEQKAWLEKQDWDDPNQFHGENDAGDCALCQGYEDQCAFCKAHRND